MIDIVRRAYQSVLSTSLLNRFAFPELSSIPLSIRVVAIALAVICVLAAASYAVGMVCVIVIRRLDKHKFKIKPDDDDILKLEQHIETLKTALSAQKALPLDSAKQSAKKMAELQVELDEALLKVPEVLRVYLEKRFDKIRFALAEQKMLNAIKGEATAEKVDDQEMNKHLSRFFNLMSAFPKKKEFIRKGIEEIDLFFTNALFTSSTEASLPENLKTNLAAFRDFFAIVDDHDAVIEKDNPQLALRLKIRLANLPLLQDSDRSKFKNIYLDEAAQRQILIDHFQKQEDEAVELALAQLATQKLTEKDVRYLAQYTVETSERLSGENRQKLRKAITQNLGEKAPKNWEQELKVHIEVLKNGFTIIEDAKEGDLVHKSETIEPYRVDEGMQFLNYVTKVKKFLKEHQEILRYYHTTEFHKLISIIDLNLLFVQKQKKYKGAWVSSKVEQSSAYGDCALGFKDIAHLDPDVFIGFEKPDFRWRGLQVDIPMKGNLLTIGMSLHWKKTEKTKIKSKLETIGIAKPKIVSLNFLAFMQKEIVKVIGHPNLTEKWWGKADVKYLEKPIAV